MSQKFVWYTFNHLLQTFAHALHNRGKVSFKQPHCEKGAPTLNSTGILPPTSTRNLRCSGYQSEQETLRNRSVWQTSNGHSCADIRSGCVPRWRSAMSEDQAWARANKAFRHAELSTRVPIPDRAERSPDLRNLQAVSVFSYLLSGVWI